MCGIAGVISFKSDMRGELVKCGLMQKALLRRGPDQRGIFLSSEAALVHTRLAVIDIEGGRQPMTLNVGERKFTIVYNGELYNTEEIRKQLTECFLSDAYVTRMYEYLLHYREGQELEAVDVEQQRA